MLIEKDEVVDKVWLPSTDPPNDDVCEHDGVHDITGRQAHTMFPRRYFRNVMSINRIERLCVGDGSETSRNSEPCDE